MSIFGKIKGVLQMLFGKTSEDIFDVKLNESQTMLDVIQTASDIYRGAPYWVSDNVKTVNFAASICSETARLTALAIGVRMGDSARAKHLQERYDNEIYYSLRKWCELADAYGTVIIKPTDNTVDCYTPNEFKVVKSESGNIVSVIFSNTEASTDGKKFFHRLEYHRFEDDTYTITNKCYESKTRDDLGTPISIENSPWDSLEEEVSIKNLDKPLFGVLRTPHANNIEPDSPLALPIYSNAIEELKDLDIAYSRNAQEVFDSEKIILLDSDRLVPDGTRISNTSTGFERARESMKLPHYVKNVYGNGDSTFYQEINPQLNTDTRIKGMNSLLSQIGYKCGFSNGYFVFNERSGMVTATQVESDDRRTIQLIKDCRDQLEKCLLDVIEAMDKFADLYKLAPSGAYEVAFDFGDITYSYAEDKAAWWGYVLQGKVPAWRYFVKFENMSEDDAKAMIEEVESAQADTQIFKEE